MGVRVARRGRHQWQVPLMHCCPAGQLVSQPPQWKLSLARFVQRQLCRSAVRQNVPAAHVEQTPLSQCCVSGQLWLHVPQCRSSWYRTTHAPLHARYGSLQLFTHDPD